MPRIKAKEARIGVIGLGYVGLPLALAFARQGFTVLGFDTDPSKVSKLERGESYIGHISHNLIRQARDHFEPTHLFERLDEPDAILICVPTPLSPTRDPDLSFVTDSVTDDRISLTARTARHPREHHLSRDNA